MENSDLDECSCSNVLNTVYFGIPSQAEYLLFADSNI